GIAATQVGGVEQGGPCRAELRYEGVPAREKAATPAATKDGLEGARGRGEVGRAGDARHVGAAVDAAVWVHSDTASKVEGAAAEEGGVDQGTPCRVELRHEGVTRTAADTKAGARGCGEGDLVGPGAARHIRAAGRIHSDGVPLVDVRVAQ